MKTIYGVNSTTPSNKRLKNGYTMYDWVMRQKCFPMFWVRTLTGENALTAEEIEFLKERDCRIVPVLRDLTEAVVSGGNGKPDAEKAVEAAKMMGIPAHQGIALVAELKPEWSVNHNWMIGFAQVLFENGYVPGFIGNTDSAKNFNFDRQCSHYVQATRAQEQYHALYGATEPKTAEMPKTWAPYCPSALEPEDMHLWICGKTAFGALEVEDAYANSVNVLAKLW